MKNYKDLFFSINKDVIEHTRTRQKRVKVSRYVLSLVLAMLMAICLLGLLNNSLVKKFFEDLYVSTKDLFVFFIFTALFSVINFIGIANSITKYFSKEDNLDAIAEEFAIKTIGKDLIDAINKKFSSDLTINESFKKAIENYWWLDYDFTLHSSMKVKLTDSNLKFTYEKKEFTLKKWKYSKKGLVAMFDIVHPDGQIEKKVSFLLSTE